MSEELKNLAHALADYDALPKRSGHAPATRAENDAIGRVFRAARLVATLKAGQGKAVAYAQSNLLDIFQDSRVTVICRATDADNGYTLPLYVAPPSDPGTVSVPPERWEFTLSRLYPTIEAGKWPKRWVDEAIQQELRELRALLAAAPQPAENSEQETRSGRGLAHQILKAQAEIKTWPDSLRELYGVQNLPEPSEWMAGAVPQPAENSEPTTLGQFLVCKGTNCTSTDGFGHSSECEAEHAAAIAGGQFVQQAEWQEPIGETCRAHQAGVIFYTHLPYPADGTKLYTTPQPAQDVSGLVEAMRAIQRLPVDDGFAEQVIERIDAALAALAAHRAKGANP